MNIIKLKITEDIHSIDKYLNVFDKLLINGKQPIIIAELGIIKGVHRKTELNFMM